MERPPRGLRPGASADLSQSPAGRAPPKDGRDLARPTRQRRGRASLPPRGDQGRPIPCAVTAGARRVSYASAATGTSSSTCSSSSFASSSAPQVRARAAFLLGQVYEEHLGDRRKAATSYEAAVGSDAGYRPAVDALARVRAEAQDWTHLLSDLERELKLSRGPDANASRSSRAARRSWSDRTSTDKRFKPGKMC